MIADAVTYELVTTIRNEALLELGRLKLVHIKNENYEKIQRERQEFNAKTGLIDGWEIGAKEIANETSFGGYGQLKKLPQYERTMWALFVRECREELIRAFVKERYGTFLSVIDADKDFIETVTNFREWFELKRKGLRKKMENGIAGTLVKGNAPVLKKSGAHGGVANLLKVLTTTMEKQGASIRTIAKVQYTICSQAGIYIPDEFLEDVAVTIGILEDSAK